jgi:hypothetical protein
MFLCHIMTQRCFMLCTTYTNFWSINCHHLSCEFEPHSRRGVHDKTLCDQVCQWLATGLWISLGTPISATKVVNWNIFESGAKHLTSNGQLISINEKNWLAESMFLVGVHWMEFVSRVKFCQLQTNVKHFRTIPFLLPPDWAVLYWSCSATNHLRQLF